MDSIKRYNNELKKKYWGYINRISNEIFFIFRLMYRVIILLILLGLFLKDYMPDYEEYVSGVMTIFFNLIEFGLWILVLFGLVLNVFMILYIFKRKLKIHKEEQ